MKKVVYGNTSVRLYDQQVNAGIAYVEVENRIHQFNRLIMPICTCFILAYSKFQILIHPFSPAEMA